MSPESRLMETLSHLSSRMLQFHSQIQDLSKLNKQLSEFNRVFASFLLSLQLTSTGVKIEYVAPEPSNAPTMNQIGEENKKEIIIQPPPMSQQTLDNTTRSENDDLVSLITAPSITSNPLSGRTKKSNVFYFLIFPIDKPQISNSYTSYIICISSKEGSTSFCCH